MNYYFLLEDEKSFMKVLPEWLKYMGVNNSRVQDITYLRENCYVMQSGQGVTQLISKVLFETIETIACNPGKVDELIVIVDSEEYDEATRKSEVISRIEEYIKEKQIVADFTYRVFVCNHCFETWLLGNRMLYPDSRPDDSFQEYYEAYNVKLDDPEKMIVPDGIKETTAVFHFHYLHEMFCHNKIRYTKRNPMYAAKKEYFIQLVNRVKETKHLRSFFDFFCYFNKMS